MAHNIDKVKDKQGDVKRNLDTKKKELNQLEERKQSLLDSGVDVQDSNMDERTKKLIMELINQALEENAEKGESLSDDMQSDLDSLTEMKDEVSEMRESTEQEHKNLESRKSILDRFGLGKNIDNAISEMNDSEIQLDSVNKSLLEDERELKAISQKLSSL